MASTLNYLTPNALNFLAALNDAPEGIAPERGQWTSFRSLERLRLAHKVDMRVYITVTGMARLQMEIGK